MWPYSNPKYPLIGLYKNRRDTTEPYGIHEYRRLNELFKDSSVFFDFFKWCSKFFFGKWFHNTFQIRREKTKRQQDSLKTKWNFTHFSVINFIIPFESFSLIWRRHNYRWRAVNFYLCSALIAFEQWGFFSVPHLLWHEASLYNGHLRGPVTLIPN